MSSQAIIKVSIDDDFTKLQKSLFAGEEATGGKFMFKNKVIED